MEYKAVNTCLPAIDTIIHGEKNKIKNIPKRKNYFQGQTPQSFEYNLILKAHKTAMATNVNDATDDCQLVLDLPHEVHIVTGDRYNIKITSKLDLLLGKQILKDNTLTRKSTRKHSEGAYLPS